MGRCHPQQSLRQSHLLVRHWVYGLSFEDEESIICFSRMFERRCTNDRRKEKTEEWSSEKNGFGSEDHIEVETVNELWSKQGLGLANNWLICSLSPRRSDDLVYILCSRPYQTLLCLTFDLAYRTSYASTPHGENILVDMTMMRFGQKIDT